MRMRYDDPLAAATGITVGLLTSAVWWGALILGGWPRVIAVGTLVVTPLFYGLLRVVARPR